MLFDLKVVNANIFLKYILYQMPSVQNCTQMVATKECKTTIRIS